MKIIFDSEQEKKNIANKMARSNFCPDDLGFARNCKDCDTCWKKALESAEVRGNGA